MHHTVFQTTLTSTKNVQKKVEEETCILILEFHVSLIIFVGCEVLFFRKKTIWSYRCSVQEIPNNHLRCFLKRCKLQGGFSRPSTGERSISEPSNHQEFLVGVQGPDVGGRCQKNRRKCAHLLGCCWSVFVIAQKMYGFEVCGGLLLKRFINKSWNIMKHVFVLWFSFCFQGVWFWARKVRKKEQRKISKGGKETLRSNANCQDCFDSSLSKREPMTPTESFCFHVLLRLLWCMKTQISR